MDYLVYPSKLTRSRKIQLKQFESEEIKVEYTIEIIDKSKSHEALKEASRLADAFLDAEEKRLRHIDFTYNLKLTEKAHKLGEFKIKISEDKQFENFIHLWFKIGDKELYVGYLHKITGEFKFKEENMEELEKLNINEECFIIEKE